MLYWNKKATMYCIIVSGRNKYQKQFRDWKVNFLGLRKYFVLWILKVFSPSLSASLTNVAVYVCVGYLPLILHTDGVMNVHFSINTWHFFATLSLGIFLHSVNNTISVFTNIMSTLPQYCFNTSTIDLRTTELSLFVLKLQYLHLPLYWWALMVFIFAYVRRLDIFFFLIDLYYP